MSELHWKFVMGTQVEPCWSVYEGDSYRRQIHEAKLVAYSKRAARGGWFVRIGNVNGEPTTEKIYIGDDVFPPDFMVAMLQMTKERKDE